MPKGTQAQPAFIGYWANYVVHHGLLIKVNLGHVTYLLKFPSKIPKMAGKS